MGEGREIAALLLTRGDLIEIGPYKGEVMTWTVVTAKTIQLVICLEDGNTYRPVVMTDMMIRIFNR